jgi:hypothetical protein
MIEHAATEGRLSDRATAVSVLGLMPHDTRAVKLAEKALKDDKAEVRAAAAAALGGMNSRRSISNLRMALDDSDPLVVRSRPRARLAARQSAYEVYYEVLNGERKTHIDWNTIPRIRSSDDASEWRKFTGSCLSERRHCLSCLVSAPVGRRQVTTRSRRSVPTQNS